MFVGIRKKKEAARLLESYIPKFINTAYYYNIELELADLCGGQYNYKLADSIYQNIIYQNPNRTLLYLSEVRKELLNKDSLLIYYLNGSDYDKYSVLQNLNLSMSQGLRKYFYSSIPVMINLTKNLDEDYKLFIGKFDKTIHVDDYASSYAMYKLSVYMLENLDFVNARKMAALSLRYKTDKNFNVVLEDNFDKANWFYFNASKYLRD